VCSDCECHRQFLAASHASRVDKLEVGRGGDIGPGFVAVAQTQPAAADVPPAGRRINRIIDRGTQIAAAVECVLWMERQLGKIDVLAGDLNRVHRCIVRRHFDQGLGTRQPFEILFVELVLTGLKGSSDALAAACRLGDKLDPLRPCVLKQHGLVRVFDDEAKFCQRYWFVVNVHLAEVDQTINKITQAVFVKIQPGVCVEHR